MVETPQNKPFTTKEIEQAKAVFAKAKSAIPQRVKPSASAGIVLDITARIKQRQEQESSERAFDKFKTDYLPFLSTADIQTITTAQDDGETLARICLRIDLERRVR